MSTLTDRYVHAATRWLPGKERETLDLELRERIADTIEARGAGPAAERDTLNELGDPLRVAAEYRDRPTWLIGPRLYFTWLRLLVLLLAIVPPLVAAAVAIATAVDGDPIGAIIGSATLAAFQTAIHVAFWTTLVFALIEHFGAGETVDESWTIDSLPEPGEPDQSSRVLDLSLSLLFLGFAIVLLFWQRSGANWPGAEGVAVLHDDLWGFWIPFWIGCLVVEMVMAGWIFARGHTIASASANTGLNVVFTGSLAWVVATRDVLNPEFVSRIDGFVDHVDTATTITVVVIALIGVWDIVDGWIKALRHRA